jgi:type IV fimbrial biogenesis protein FimT
MRGRRDAGFNLVELLIGISIAAMLLVLAAPPFTDFIVNTQVRNAAESVATGLRTAQAQAIKRNTNCNAGSPNTCVEFILDPANGWDIVDQAGPTTLATYRWATGSAQHATVVIVPVGATTVSFNSLGRIVLPNNPRDGTAPIQRVRFTSTSTATAHSLQVYVTEPGYGIWMCDANLPPTDPKYCP